MLPIRDDNPTHRSAIVTGLLVAACVWAFFAEQPFDPAESVQFLYERAAISCELVTGDPLTPDEIQSGICESVPGPSVFPDKSILLSALTSLFLHANLAHLFGNMWIFWIFGNNIEDHLGHVRFLLFYVASGIVATATFVALNPSSTVPLIGASGAIAGAMGAYLILFPTTGITAIVPPFFFFPFRVPAWVFLGLWLAGQFAISSDAGQVAWEAHVGGFIAGASYAVVRRKQILRRGRRYSARYARR
ncbi:MAG: rhomboid family intramembrane serine protease [Acidimicrobiia bacterium]|nr:rhomboid family intramembrane serine protease [Acidimicrobiia bacterium]